MILRYTWSSRDSSFHSKVKEAIDSSTDKNKANNVQVLFIAWGVNIPFAFVLCLI